MTKGAIVIALLITTFPSIAMAKDTRFWNLTAATIASLQLSPAGRNQWGIDQAVNDPDHSVDHDERLKITGAATGRYDVRFVDSAGRTCIVENVAIREGAVFSIEEKNLRNCSK